jgi:2-keto-4-pentenoate hydratase
MRAAKNQGIVILLVSFFVYSCSYCLSFASEESPQTAEPDIRASLLKVAKQYLDVTPADSFSYNMTMEEAYKWQNEFMKLLEPELGKVIGYKAGGFDKSRQDSETSSRYWRGTFLEKMFFNSGAHISFDSFINSFIESDLLLRVGSEEINTATTDDEILSALDAVIPFIEFPDAIFKSTGWPRDRSTGIITNMGTRIGVMGKPIPLTTSEDCKDRLNTFRIVMTDQDGMELGSNSVEAKYEPLEVVRWLRDSLREGGKALEKGHLLSLGNLGVVAPLVEGAGGPAGSSEIFTGSRVKLTYLGLDPAGPAEVVVNFDRRQK